MELSLLATLRRALRVTVPCENQMQWLLPRSPYGEKDTLYLCAP
jgi:hypothetical protein